MLLSNYSEFVNEAGVDEVGRGCLSGPVVAAAVILPADYKNESLNDSKKLSATKREAISEIIKKDALAWAIAEVDNNEIDRINILNASFLAMTRAIKKMPVEAEFLLIDGNRFKSDLEIPYECIIKGDGKYLSIAAASILAKTYRDELMKTFHLNEPFYAWDKNKGYPTKEHRMGILQHGVSNLHRKSFQLLPSQLEMFNK